MRKNVERNGKINPSAEIPMEIPHLTGGTIPEHVDVSKFLLCFKYLNMREITTHTTRLDQIRHIQDYPWNNQSRDLRTKHCILFTFLHFFLFSAKICEVCQRHVQEEGLQEICSQTGWKTWRGQQVSSETVIWKRRFNLLFKSCPFMPFGMSYCKACHTVRHAIPYGMPYRTACHTVGMPYRTTCHIPYIYAPYDMRGVIAQRRVW